MTAAFALWCLALLVRWVPGYLTWPYFTDHDHFAIIAQRWSGGFLPYRDSFTTQFPGEIYLFSLIGKVAGWGHSAAFYAVDAAMVVGFGALLLAWGKGKSGRWLPGWVGCTVFLNYYASQDFTVAGQRDWHGMSFAAAGLMVLDLLPGRAGRIVSGVAYGIALAFRPQFVLLGPAFALALAGVSRDRPGAPRRMLLAWFEWGAIAAIAMALAYLPLALAGVLDDFVRCIKGITYGAGYNTRSLAERIARTRSDLLARPWLVAVPLAILGLKSESASRAGRGAWTVVASLVGMIAYSTISPLPHAYYDVPLFAAFAMAIALLAGLLLDLRVDRPALVVSAILLIACLGWHVPRMAVRDQGSLGPIRSLGLARAGTFPERAPAGWIEPFHPYRWDDYRALVLYLRERTTPDTPVASFLFEFVSAVNGAVPRPSPLPCDAVGLLVFQDLLDEDLAALAAGGPCVVLLDPVNHPDARRPEFKGFLPKLGPLLDLIRRDFRLETTIGPFEVWRRDGAISDAPRPPAG